MKTIKPIILTALTMILMSNITLGSSYKRFPMLISGDKIIEVYTKVEAEVMEYLPQTVKTTTYASERVLTFEVVAEQLVEEDLILCPKSRLMVSNEELKVIIAEITQPEVEVTEEELGFVTAMAK